MKKFWLGFLPFLLVSCTNSVSFVRASYDATFAMATCGNLLNPNIYSPDSGPDGFVSYRTFFAERISLRLERDFSCELGYTVKGESGVNYRGKYESQKANANQMILHFETDVFELHWFNYYQLVFECEIHNPNSGEQLHAVALLHSTNIFTT